MSNEQQVRAVASNVNAGSTRIDMIDTVESVCIIADRCSVSGATDVWPLSTVNFPRTRIADGICILAQGL